MDGPDAGRLVLGYTVIYPSCSVRRPSVKAQASTRGDDSDLASKEGRAQTGGKVEVEAAAGGAPPTRAAAAAPASLQATNCTLNSVLVPEHLRGLHLGQALVHLSVHLAREVGRCRLTR